MGKSRFALAGMVAVLAAAQIVTPASSQSDKRNQEGRPTFVPATRPVIENAEDIQPPRYVKENELEFLAVDPAYDSGIFKNLLFGNKDNLQNIAPGSTINYRNIPFTEFNALKNNSRTYHEQTVIRRKRGVDGKIIHEHTEFHKREDFAQILEEKYFTRPIAVIGRLKEPVVVESESPDIYRHFYFVKLELSNPQNKKETIECRIKAVGNTKKKNSAEESKHFARALAAHYNDCFLPGDLLSAYGTAVEIIENHIYSSNENFQLETDSTLKSWKFECHGAEAFRGNSE